VVIVLFEMVLVHGLQARDPVRVVGVGAVFTCIGFGLLPLGQGFAFVAGTVLVWTVGEMLSFSVASAAIANRANDANRGRYLGYYTLVFAVALVLAPLTGTWVYERLGYAALWYGCAALALPLGAGFWAVARAWKVKPA
jgi:MFS family permease